MSPWTSCPDPDRATFRLPAAALLVPVLLAFCIAPLATAGGGWAVLFVVPVVALVWVIITRTTVTPTRVTAHGLFGSRGMAWTDLDGLEFQDSRWAVAVGLDGRRLRLPMVRPRDLPRLAAVSGGSLRLGAMSADTQPTADPDLDARSTADPDADAKADADPRGLAQPGLPPADAPTNTAYDGADGSVMAEPEGGMPDRQQEQPVAPNLAPASAPQDGLRHRS